MAVEPSGSSPVNLKPTHVGDQHRHGLAEHGRFGLDAADPPAEDAEAVDHGGVRVGAEQGVGVRLAVFGREHHPGQVLQVDLVADPGVRRDHLQGAEGLLAPAQEPVALPVALELELGVAGEGVGAAGEVGDDRVVDDQLGRDLGLDRGGVARRGPPWRRAWRPGRRPPGRR